jgi:hypothetical protein
MQLLIEKARACNSTWILKKCTLKQREWLYQGAFVGRNRWVSGVAERPYGLMIS